MNDETTGGKYLGDATLTQFSTIGALLVGLYDGAFSVSTICKAGTLGLGCSHGIDGEMILLDGRCYVAKADTPLVRMQDEDLLPFAQVVEFLPEGALPLNEVVGKQALTDALLQLAATQNLFIGFRIDGRFKRIAIRQPPALQTKPYPPMVEALANQVTLDLLDEQGTLVGFWSPKLYQGVTVADIHFHYVNHDKSVGGHVLDVEIEAATLEYQRYSRFNLHLPIGNAALDAKMNYADLDAHIRQAEG